MELRFHPDFGSSPRPEPCSPTLLNSRSVVPMRLLGAWVHWYSNNESEQRADGVNKVLLSLFFLGTGEKNWCLRQYLCHGDQHREPVQPDPRGGSLVPHHSQGELHIHVLSSVITMVSLVPTGWSLDTKTIWKLLFWFMWLCDILDYVMLPTQFKG